MSVASTKTMNVVNSPPSRPVACPAPLALVLMLLLGTQSASGWQAAAPLDGSKVQTNNLRSVGKSEIQFEQLDQIQTFRIQTSDGPAKGAVGSVRQVQVLPGGGPAFQVESFSRRIQLPGTTAIEVFAGTLPTRGNHQIVVEMKKVRDNQKDRSIGYFAPESWIESRNGQVRFLEQTTDWQVVHANPYWIGVRCQEVVTDVERSDSTSPQISLVVEDVVPQSAAEQAGIRVRDQLVAWNQQPLASVDQLVATIQANQQKVADVELVRDGESLKVQVTPEVRSVARSFGRTVIVPTARLQVAQQKIEELKELVVRADGEPEQVRVLLVGPGVNFGQQEIELQLDPEALVQKTSLKKVLDRVADQKFGLSIKGDSFTFKSTPDAQDMVVSSDLDFEPHEIWETMQVEVNGKKIAFQQLVPRIVERQAIQIHSEENPVAEPLPFRVQQLQAGQIAFPNPLGSLREVLQEEIKMLQRENETIREENQRLQAELRKLRDQLPD